MKTSLHCYNPGICFTPYLSTRIELSELLVFVELTHLFADQGAKKKGGGKQPYNLQTSPHFILIYFKEHLFKALQLFLQIILWGS